MQKILEIATHTWAVALQMAPYLLLGFLMAGALSVLVKPETVERHLGKRTLWQVVKASLFGVPLPLCSCSVVPVSASLYRHGASKGATVSFLASTPQTGVDSIAVTWSLLGPVVVLFRVVVAFVSGVVAGVGVELLDDGARETAGQDGGCGCCGGDRIKHPVLRGLHHGFVTLPRDIGRAMLFGIVLSGVLAALVPENYFADRLGSGITGMLVMMAVGIPIYACSSGSVPVALGLMHAGVSPGAALVFLVTGPATNAATVTTISRLLGRRTVVIYLASIAGVALAGGLLLDRVVTPGKMAAMGHAAREAGIVEWIFGVLLIGILLPSLGGGWIGHRLKRLTHGRDQGAKSTSSR